MMMIELTRDDGDRKEFLVSDDGPLMTLALSRTSYITNRLYLWIELHRTPTRTQLRAFRHEFSSIVGGFTLLCNVERDNVPARKFAEHFGFRVKTECADILMMERAA